MHRYGAVLMQTAQEFKEFILANRALIIERDLWPSGSQSPSRGPYFRFNWTLPLIKDGVLEKSSCPDERSSDRANGLSVVWSQEKQDAFENELNRCGFNWARFEQVAKTYKNHWQNIQQTWALPEHVKNCDPVYFLEPYHPGITVVLHNLSKTPLFNTMQEVDPYRHGMLLLDVSHKDDGSSEIVSTYPKKEIDSWGSLFVEGDALSRKYGTKLRPNYRARMIASRGMIEWTSRNNIFKDWEQLTCAFCGELFWPQNLGVSEIGKMGFPRYCISCCDLRRDVWHVQSWDVEERRKNAIRAVHLFYEMTNVFPSQAVKKEPIAQLSDNLRDEWMFAQILLPGPSFKELFGTWNELLAVAGLLEKKPRKGKGGYVTKSPCGHICLSLSERRICDELHNLGVAHDKEPLYPVHPELNPNGKLRGDWRIGDHLIEFAGYMDDAEYKKNMVKKQTLAEIEGIPIVVLLPTDIRNITTLLSNLFLKDS